MKKHLKLLVLLLSLALIIGCVTIVAGAADSGNVAKVGDSEYATLAEAVNAAGEGETVVLIADATSGAINVTKSVTVDLGGHTLTSTAGVLFDMKAAVEFNLIGEGTVNSAGLFINNASFDYAPKVTVTSSGKGMTVNHLATTHGSFVEMAAGSFTFNGVHFDTALYAGAERLFEMYTNSTATLVFNNCSIMY